MSVNTDIQAAEKQVQRIGVFLTGHHIVLYLLLAAALGLGIYTFESKYAALQEARATSAEQALAVEKDHSAQLTQAFQQAQAQRDLQNAQFQQTILALQKQTQVQIIHDKALPAPELGNRIETLTGFKQGAITLDSSQDLIVPLPLGQEIVAKLDQGLADSQTVIQQAGIIKNQADTISGQISIIAEDKKVLADQILADTKVLNAEKAKCRKSKFKWFGAGVVVGFIGREILKP
jgi:hypothetical protein